MTPSRPESATARANEPVPNYGIAEEFPLLWERSKQYEFAHRLGGCTDPLLTEIDAALRELWMSRRARANV